MRFEVREDGIYLIIEDETGAHELEYNGDGNLIYNG